MPSDTVLMRLPGVARFESRVQGLAHRVMQDGGRETQSQARDTRNVVVQTSPVASGFFRAHWGPVTERGHALAWGFDNPTPYGPTLEYGGYRRAGPRTVALGSADLGAGFQAGAGVYSRQAPHGFLRKALAQACPAFRRRIETVLRRAWAARDMGSNWPVTAQATAAPLTGDLGAIFGIMLEGGSGRLSPGTQRVVTDVLRGLQRSRRTTPRRRT